MAALLWCASGLCLDYAALLAGDDDKLAALLEPLSVSPGLLAWPDHTCASRDRRVVTSSAFNARVTVLSDRVTTFILLTTPNKI